MTEDMKVLTSLLDECIGEISSLHIKIKELEDKIATLENNKSRSQELSSLPSKSKAIALTEVSTDTELSSDLEARIQKVVDLIIKNGQSLSYIQRR